MKPLGLNPSNYAKAVFLLSIGLVALALALPLASAQTGLGTVSGTVRDPSEAAVPEAQVTVTSTETGLARSAQTSSAGSYYFGALRLGPYKLTVERQGFTTWESTFTLAVGQNAIINPTLLIGSTTTFLRVSGALVADSRLSTYWSSPAPLRRHVFYSSSSDGYSSGRAFD